ncbi:hypothetical protein ACN081_02205 [Rothia sp. P13129]|uniref:hypothetical protein n=1 Tax=Rothia sp. P13129 TaxID=3402664 RepID=UPI003ACEE162
MNSPTMMELAQYRGFFYISEVAPLLNRSVKALQNERSAQKGFMAEAYRPEGQRFVRIPYETVIKELNKK